MPTGYTEKVLEGESFAEFALHTTTAFSYLARDLEDPARDPLPEGRTSKYHAQELEKAKKRLKIVMKMSFKAAAEEARKEAKRTVAEIGDRIGKQFADRTRLTEMMNQVIAYEPPPTERHRSHKQYMIEQLQTTLDHDCDPKYELQELKRHKVLSGPEWKAREIRSAKHDIAYHTREMKKDAANFAEDADFIQQLRAKFAPDLAPK